MRRTIEVDDAGTWTLWAPGEDGPVIEATAAPGDQWVLRHKDSATTMVCLVAKGDLTGRCSIDRMMLSYLRSRIETLQRLVDEGRSGGG